MKSLFYMKKYHENYLHSFLENPLSVPKLYQGFTSIIIIIIKAAKDLIKHLSRDFKLLLINKIQACSINIDENIIQLKYLSNNWISSVIHLFNKENMFKMNKI